MGNVLDGATIHPFGNVLRWLDRASGARLTGGSARPCGDVEKTLGIRWTPRLRRRRIGVTSRGSSVAGHNAGGSPSAFGQNAGLQGY